MKRERERRLRGTGGREEKTKETRRKREEENRNIQRPRVRLSYTIALYDWTKRGLQLMLGHASIYTNSLTSDTAGRGDEDEGEEEGRLNFPSCACC